MASINSLPHSVDFRPIGECNLRCTFCFGPRHNIETMSTANILQVVDFIGGNGTKAVVLSGGEPTLIDDLPVILRHMKLFNLKIVLSTNGIFFERRMDEIAPYLDWIALPLDASTMSENQKMRIDYPNHFEIVVDLIPKIRSKYPQLKIKLGTVVSKINKDSVADIPSVLLPDALPNLWKIYQVTYKNYGNDNKILLEISDKEFDDVVLEASEKASLLGMLFVGRKNFGRDGKHMFIEPNGDVVVIYQDEDIIIGNILTNPEHVLQTLPEFIDDKKLRKNFEATYP